MFHVKHYGLWAHYRGNRTMQHSLRPVWAEINMNSLQRNLQTIEGLIPPGVGILAVVKANAYGVGAIPISRAAIKMNRVVGLAVATPDEAVELREAGLDGMILVLAPVTQEAALQLTKKGVSMTVSSAQGIKAAETAALRVGRKAGIHLKIETGMGRVGFIPGPEFKAALDLLSQCNHLRVEGMFSHFAGSDESRDYTLFQMARFKTALNQSLAAGIRPSLVHISNSAAILQFPDAAFDVVRPGIMMYGYYPNLALCEKAQLYPVLSLKARISHMKSVDAGTCIGYGMTYKVPEPTTIATIPLGFADGYPRLLSGKASVLIKGRRYPLAGRVCMDQCMVDLKGSSGIAAGDIVTLIGKDGEEEITLYEIAEFSGTIVHEILTGITSRVPRIYI